MSIYSGFSIRTMQQKYNKLLGRLISMLQSDVIEFMSPLAKKIAQPLDIESYLTEKFNKYLSLLSKLEGMEKHKYLQPKFSQCCETLKNFICQLIPCNFSEQPSTMSNSSLINEISKNAVTPTNKKPISQSKFLHQNFKSKYQSQKTKRSKRESKSLDSITNNTSKINIANLVENDNIQQSYPIYTIHEVQEDVSTKQFKKINTEVICFQGKNQAPNKKQFKQKIYKSMDKMKLFQYESKQSDEPDFPTYDKQSRLNKTLSSFRSTQNQNKSKTFRQAVCKKMKTSRNSRPHNTFRTFESFMSQTEKGFYLTDINFKSPEMHEFKKITIPSKKRAQHSMNTPQSQKFIHVNYKRLVDRSKLKKLVVQ